MVLIFDAEIGFFVSDYKNYSSFYGMFSFWRGNMGRLG